MDAPITTTDLLVQIIDGGKILKGKPFVVIDKQILFWDDEKQCYFFTQIEEDNTYDVDDYTELPENAPYQLINGKLEIMPSPNYRHQDILGSIYFNLKYYLSNNKVGTVQMAPLDVHFNKYNVYQPDILFVSIARASIIQKWIYGAPDFIVEILSEKNYEHDTVQKKKVYGKYNVIEYWIVHPKEEIVEVFHNKNSEMQLAKTAFRNDTIYSIAIKGFELEVNRIFE